MGGYWQWVGVIQSKFAKSPRHRTIIVNQINNTKTVADEEEKYPKENGDHQSLKKQEFSLEDIAATKIQAFFRGYLARQAFRALRSLVKVQALVRGVQVRKQSRIALHCMHALVRLQVTIRARQLLSRASDD